MADMSLDPGRVGRATRVVTNALTAIQMGSGDVAVMGTPALLALMEEACVDAVRDELADGQTSVGAWVELEHMAPSKVGAKVEATATLTAVEGRKLSFTAEAHDGETLIGRASLSRVISDRSRFG